MVHANSRDSNWTIEHRANGLPVRKALRNIGDDGFVLTGGIRPYHIKCYRLQTQAVCLDVVGYCVSESRPRDCRREWRWDKRCGRFALFPGIQTFEKVVHMGLQYLEAEGLGGDGGYVVDRSRPLPIVGLVLGTNALNGFPFANEQPTEYFSIGILCKTSGLLGGAHLLFQEHTCRILGAV